MTTIIIALAASLVLSIAVIIYLSVRLRRLEEKQVLQVLAAVARHPSTRAYKLPIRTQEQE